MSIHLGCESLLGTCFVLLFFVLMSGSVWSADLNTWIDVKTGYDSNVASLVDEQASWLIETCAGIESEWQFEQLDGSFFVSGSYRYHEAVEDQNELTLGASIGSVFLGQRLQPWAKINFSWLNDDYVPKDDHFTLKLEAGSDWLAGPVWVISPIIAWMIEDYSNEQYPEMAAGRNGQERGCGAATDRQDQVFDAGLTISYWYRPELVMHAGLGAGQRFSSLDQEDGRYYGSSLATELQFDPLWTLAVRGDYEKLNYHNSNDGRQDDYWQAALVLSRETNFGIVALRLNQEWNCSSARENSWKRSLVLCEFSLYL